MTIDRFRDVLTSVGPAPDARELSELLWLACQMGQHEREAPAAPAAPPPVTRPDPERGPPDLPAARLPEAAPPPQRPELHPSTQEVRAGGEAKEVLVPTAPMLTDPLGVQRALRPLKRRVPSRLRRELDEDATAARIADTRLWTPVLVPAPERWLSLALVVDTGPTMRLWRPLARELAEAIQRQGAFRDIRVAYLDQDGRVSASPTGAPQAPATLLDPSGRQVVLILSDCSGPHWWNGRAPRAVRRWAEAGPTAILQPLPERLWRRSAAPTTPGLASLPRPGGPNSALMFAPYDGSPPPDLPVPVLEVVPRWLASWANLLSGAGPQPAAMAAFAAGEPATAPVQREQRLPIDERVHRFLATASPGAAELAAHVAVSVPSLPVMRLIQHRILGASGPSQLAEVLLSGLLRPDEEHYDFVPGAREALLATLPRPEALHTRHVLAAVSAEIERRAGIATETFPALLHAPGGDRSLPSGTPTFATLTPETHALLDVPAPPAADPLALLGLPRPDDPGADFARELTNLRASPRTRIPLGTFSPSGLPVTVGMPRPDDPRRGGLIIGDHGSGKTELLRTLVLGLALTHAPGDLDIVLVAKTGSPLLSLGALPHVVATLPSEASRDWVWTMGLSLEERFAELGRDGEPPPPPPEDAYQRSSWVAAEMNAPLLFIVVDDADDLIATDPDFAALLDRLFTQSAPPGVHLIASTTMTGLSQIAEMGDRAWSVNFPQRTTPGAGDIWFAGHPDASHFQVVRYDELVSRAVQVALSEAASPAVRESPVLHELLGLPDPAASPEVFQRELAWVRAAPWGLVPVGVDETGRAIGPTWSRGLAGSEGNALVFGPTTSGKTELLCSFVLGLALMYSPEQVNIVLVEGFPSALSKLAGLPHVTGLLNDPEDVPAFTAALNEELDRRSNSRTGPQLFVVVDHAEPLNTRHARFAGLLGRIAHNGPSMGVIRVLSAQSDNALGADLPVDWRVDLAQLPEVGGELRARDEPPVTFRRLYMGAAQAEATVAQLAAYDTSAPPLLDETRPGLLLDPYSEPHSFRREWDKGPERPRAPLVGLNAQTEPVPLNPLDHQRHGAPGLVVGEPDDRQEVMRTLVLALAMAYSPRDLGIVLAGLGEHPLGSPIQLPHILAAEDELLPRPERLQRLIGSLTAELDRRRAALREAGAPSWLDHRQLPALLVVFDVSLTLPASKPEVFDVLLRLAQRGRQVGVHLVIATSVMDRTSEWDRLSPLFTWRILASPSGSATNQHVLGRGHLPFPDGERSAYLRTGDSAPFRFVLPRSPSERDLDLLSRRMVRHAPPARQADSPGGHQAPPPAGKPPEAPRREVTGDRLFVGTGLDGQPVWLAPFTTPGSEPHLLVIGLADDRRKLLGLMFQHSTTGAGVEEAGFMVATSYENGLGDADRLRLLVNDQDVGTQAKMDQFFASVIRELAWREEVRGRPPGARLPALTIVIDVPPRLTEMPATLTSLARRCAEAGAHFVVGASYLDVGIGTLVSDLFPWRLAVSPIPKAEFTSLFGTGIAPFAWDEDTGYLRPPIGSHQVIRVSDAPRLEDLRIPIGVEPQGGEQVSLDLDADPHLAVVGPYNSGKTNALSLILDFIFRTQRDGQALVAILDPPSALAWRRPRWRSELDVRRASTHDAVAPLVHEVGRIAHARLPVMPESEHRAPSAEFEGPENLFLIIVDGQEMDDPLDSLRPMLGREMWTGLHIILAREPTPASGHLDPSVERLHELGTPLLLLPEAHGAEADLWEAIPAEQPGLGILVRDGRRQTVRLDEAPPL